MAEYEKGGIRSNVRAVIVKEYMRLSKLPFAAYKYSWIIVSAAYTRRLPGSYREGSCEDNAKRRNAAVRADIVTNLRISGMRV